MAKHLIKRNSNNTNDGIIEFDLINGWKTDIARNKFPVEKGKLNIGDEIFLAESGYAIFGKGTVSEVFFHEFSYDELVDFAFNKSKLKEEKIFWFNKLKKYHQFRNTSNTSNIKVLEFKIENGIVFSIPKVLEKRFLYQSTWYHLENDFNIGQIEPIDHKLLSKIPGELRKECFHKYNVQPSPNLLLDVDHFVPKSVGAPGNIIENLIPLGHTLNILKSDSIPSGLFKYGEKYNIEISSDLKISPEGYYYKNKNATKTAKLIVAEINKDYEEAKQTYLEIKKYHFSQYEH